MGVELEVVFFASGESKSVFLYWFCKGPKWDLGWFRNSVGNSGKLL
jgi:hypothetical protein